VDGLYYGFALLVDIRTANRMTKKLYTSIDIAKLVMDQKLETLILNKGDLITPLARDTAKEMGLVIVDADLPSKSVSSIMDSKPSASVNPSSSNLEDRVRKIVTSLLGENNISDNQVANKRPIVHVDGRGLTMPAFPFDLKRPEMDVRLEDVITAQHGSPMAAGFLSMHKGSFPWTLTYDEVQFVVEGELHIGTEHGVIVGKPGDVLYIPKNTAITFGTPNWAKFFYVTYPAEWSG
jgi:ethanolamine utilization protein EutQ